MLPFPLYCASVLHFISICYKPQTIFTLTTNYILKISKWAKCFWYLCTYLPSGVLLFFWYNPHFHLVSFSFCLMRFLKHFLLAKYVGNKFSQFSVSRKKIIILAPFLRDIFHWIQRNIFLPSLWEYHCIVFLDSNVSVGKSAVSPITGPLHNFLLLLRRFPHCLRSQQFS